MARKSRIPTLSPEQSKKAAHFLKLLQDARSRGKDWWVEMQMRQLAESVAADQKIAALTEALEMVRDADEDCHKDGLPTIPPEARSKIDRALAFEPPVAKFGSPLKAEARDV